MPTARTATTASHRTRPAAPPRARRRAQARARSRARRRRAVWTAVALAAAALAYTVVAPFFHHAVQEVVLPLRHEDVIRQQAAAKGLDPALIAGVIYTESRFRDGQVSSAGAQGLMQLTPATATYLAQKSGGSAFTVDDLGTAQVNIAYGAYYLRYLLDRYDGNQTLALAAYNGGEGNVNRWIRQAGRPEGDLRISDIPFPETRAYVTAVQAARRSYRATYASQLGL